jgi:FixJ family two-component response regulator
VTNSVIFGVLPDYNSSAVCLLDDQACVLKSLVRLLSSAGLKAEPFSEPDKFLNYAKAHQSPVAVIDIWMQTMNGLEVQSQLRHVSPSTRVIVMTANDAPHLRATAADAGAAAFLIKPFDDEEFLAIVRRALRANGR